MAVSHDQASGPLAQTADVLSDVLEVVRLNAALFFLVDASTPWIADAPAGALLGPAILPRVQHIVSYHVVTGGQCWCLMAGSEPVLLETGDVVVVPHGDAYLLASDPQITSGVGTDDTLAWFRQMASTRLPVVVEEGGGQMPRLRLACGFLGCDALPFNPVLATLPRLFHVRRSDLGDSERLKPLVDMAVAESRAKQAGSRSMLLRVGELLFLEVVRCYLATLSISDRGWLAGLRDPLVGRALAHLHQKPAFPWTIDALAREVATSRSVLADRFTHLVGHPPMQYLTRWRMQIAAGLLADGVLKVSAVAARVGYESEAAFSRAFKKYAGASPAAWRRGQM